MSDDEEGICVETTDELQRELNENAATVLWCFLWEQAALIHAHHGREPSEEWQRVMDYLLDMLRHGPKAPGLVGFAESSPRLAAEVLNQQVQWQEMLEDLEPGGLRLVHTKKEG